jgi:hypothetical protein
MITTSCTIEATPMIAEAGAPTVYIVVLRAVRKVTKIFYFIRDDIHRSVDMISCHLLNLPPPDKIYNVSKY